MLTVDPNIYSIIIDRGDDQELKVTIVDSAGAALNVTGATFKFTVKASIDDTLANAKFQKDSAVGGHFDLTQAVSGIVTVNLIQADTEGLAGLYLYDLEMVLSGKKRTIIAAAPFYVRKDAGTTGATPPAPTVGVTFPDWIGITTFLYWRDAADAKWVKFRLFNRNMEYVSESSNPPPF